jgi:SpoU rRNA methylase family enzyme
MQCIVLEKSQVELARHLMKNGLVNNVIQDLPSIIYNLNAESILFLGDLNCDIAKRSLALLNRLALQVGAMIVVISDLNSEIDLMELRSVKSIQLKTVESRIRHKVA